MINRFLYGIFDSKSGQLTGPVVSTHNDEFVKREVISSFSSTSLFCLYPSDYFICKLGSLDLSTGRIVPEFSRLCSMADVMPDKFKQYALDGSFTSRTAAGGESE